MNFLISIYRFLFSEKFRTKILEFRKRRKLNGIKLAILSYYKTNPASDKEINTALSFLKKNELSIFPYEFSKKYHPSKIEVMEDKSSGLLYVNFNEHKLFF